MAHPYCHMWQDFLLFMAKNWCVCVCMCVYLPVLYPLVTVRLFPCPCYYQEHCSKYGYVIFP